MREAGHLYGGHRNLSEEGWTQEPDDGFLAHVGPLWRFAGDAVSRHAVFAQDKHRNRRGVVQGGMLMTLADRNMGSCARENRPDVPVATLQFAMSFIAPARLGGWLECEAETEKRTRSVVFVRGRITQSGVLVATATGVWKLLARSDERPRPYS